MDKIKKKESFLLGAATSAYQTEGNNIHSDYWAMEQMSTSGFADRSLDAVDHYNHYEEDIQLMAKAGLNTYRFSIEWARIEPEPGVFSETEIDHYRKVLMCCHENNIEPVVTMHHFSSPKWLIEKGGWEAEETVEYFSAYCRYVIERLGTLMRYVCTINEANMGLQVTAIAERYKQQMQKSSAQVGINLDAMMSRIKEQTQENIRTFGIASPQTFVSPRTTEGDILIMKVHQVAKKAIKSVNPKLKVGLTLSLHDIQYISDGEFKAQKIWDDEFLHYIPYIADDDFFGLQNYTRSLVGPDGILPNPEDSELTQMGYEYYPEALCHVIRSVDKSFYNFTGRRIPIMITENGIATDDDNRRVSFIKEVVDGIRSCISDGIPVIGYLYWSLLDNFEWQKGYSMKFGLISVDRVTMKRTPKDSLYYLGSYTEILND